MKFLRVFLVAACLSIPVHSQPLENTKMAAGLPDTAQIRILKLQISQEKYISKQKKNLLQLEELAWRTGDKQLQAETWQSLSYIALQQAQYPQTIKYAQDALAYFESNNNRVRQLWCYRVIANVYSLLSPEQAYFYYNKAWEYANQSDSIGLAVSLAMMAADPSTTLDEPKLADLRKISVQKLAPPQLGAINYLTAHALLNEKKIDDALQYLSEADSYFSGMTERSFMDAVCKQEFARLYMMQGDIAKARQYLNESSQLCLRDSFMMIHAYGIRLASEIEKVAGNEVRSLVNYKNFISLRDSLLGINQPYPLTDILMGNLLADSKKKDNKLVTSTHNVLYILLLSIFAVGMGVLFHLKNLSRNNKSIYDRLVNMFEKEEKIGANPQFKQHFSKIIFAYKKGLDYCIKQSMNRDDSGERLKILNQYIDEANIYVDKIKEWIDVQPYTDIQKVNFDSWEVMHVVIRMHEVIFASKSIKVDYPSSPKTIVFGEMVHFAVAFEYLLFESMETAQNRAIVTVLAIEDDEQIVFSIANPAHAAAYAKKEAFDSELKALEMYDRMQAMPGNEFAVCVECVRQNNGRLWLECDPGKGTTYCFTIPKGSGEVESWQNQRVK